MGTFASWVEVKSYLAFLLIKSMLSLNNTIKEQTIVSENILS